jgi:formamidopyrimidine-DNA glycosylase
MPELPEVETTLRGIRPLLEHSIVQAVNVRQRKLRWPVTHGLARRIRGEEILKVARRAKYLLLIFHHGTLMIHLGMSGRLRVLPVSVPPGKHDHVDLVFANRRVLRFHDPRRFGSVLWVQGDPLCSPQLAHLGPEPFDEAFCGRMLFEAAKGRRVAVKNFIMDGRIVVGVGNIYANEALFRSGILPSRSAGRVALHRYHCLAASIQEVLTEAIEAGGTTLRDYVRVTGEPGYFEQALQVYERAGKPCLHCNNVIRRKLIGQRAAYYCVNCQR